MKTKNRLEEKLHSINAAKGSGFITEIHCNGRKGIAFRRLWGEKIDFIPFEIVETAEGPHVNALNLSVNIS